MLPSHSNKLKWMEIMKYRKLVKVKYSKKYYSNILLLFWEEMWKLSILRGDNAMKVFILGSWYQTHFVSGFGDGVIQGLTSWQ